MSGDESEPGLPSSEEVHSSGIDGLDKILRGGFPREGMHIIQGGPGTGKTTLALQYLLRGTADGDRGLYFTASQSRRGLERIARSHGWSLDGITVHELSPNLIGNAAAADQSVLHTADVELDELTHTLRDVLDKVAPRRVILDSLGALRLLAASTARFHREVIRLQQFLVERNCTGLFLADWPTDSAAGGEVDLQTLATSMIHLSTTSPDYGEVRRSLRVVKVRGVAISGGCHNFRIRTGGLQVFPRLALELKREYTEFRTVPSGIKVLDELLGGGLENGTTCMLIGPPGSGKSSLGSVFVRKYAEQGGRSTIFLFDERPETFKGRAAGLGVNLQPAIEAGNVSVVLLDPAEITPGEFAQSVRSAVERDQSRLIMIDSLTGYFNAMGSGQMLAVQMHELITFLSRSGVLTLLVVAEGGGLGVGPTNSQTDISYLSDSIILMRMFETGGMIRRCLSALKKRQGEHETTIREILIKPGSIDVSAEPLNHLRHILGGDPDPVTVLGEGCAVAANPAGPGDGG
jgi:circadian clock protein KaiC